MRSRGRPPGTLVGGQPGGSPGPRGSAADRGRLAVRAAGPRDVRVVRPPAAGPDGPVLAVSLGRRRAGDVGRAVELRDRPQRPRLLETLFNAFRLVLFFSLIPVALGSRHGERHPARGTRPPRHGVADGAVPAAGHPARRRRHHLGPAAVAARPRQPGPHRHRARRRHPCLARRLRHGPARRRASSGSGCCSASARSCC